MSEFLPLPPISDDPFAVVKEGRAALKARQEELAGWVKNERKGKVFSPPSTDTLADYQREVGRLLKKGGNPWDAAVQTTKLSTWLKRKSALLCLAEREVNRLLKEQDRLQRTGPQSGTDQFKEWVNVLKSLHFYTSVLSARPATDSRPLEVVKRRESKRKLGKVPEDWREILVARLPTWRRQAMVQAVTGCRPAEIGLGVKLLVKQGQLLAHIQGKKTGLYSGQIWRAMIWSLNDAPPLVCELAEMVNKAGGEMIVDYKNRPNLNPAKAFSGAMRQAAVRAFPGHTVTITPYSMRHALASDLKASGLTSQDQSAALGHQVVETKSTYGSYKQGLAGGVAPGRVQAEKAVRGDPSTPPKKPAKQAVLRNSLLSPTES